MSLTPEQSKELEQMAYLLIPLELIAFNMEIPLLAFREELKDSSSDIYRAFNKGLLKQKIELHSGIITASRNGSNPAQEQVRLMMQKLESELKHG